MQCTFEATLFSLLELLVSWQKKEIVPQLPSRGLCAKFPNIRISLLQLVSQVSRAPGRRFVFSVERTIWDRVYKHARNDSREIKTETRPGCDRRANKKIRETVSTIEVTAKGRVQREKPRVFRVKEGEVAGQLISHFFDEDSRNSRCSLCPRYE